MPDQHSPVDFNKIIFERPAIDSDDENDPKNAVSSDEESVSVKYATPRRESQESTASTVSDVDDLSDQFNSTLKVEENTKDDSQVESLIDKLKTELRVADEDSFQGRSPVKQPAHYVQNRGAPYPGQNQRNTNHFSGGYVSQPNIDYGQLVGQTPRSASASPETIPQLVQPVGRELAVLDPDELSNFFNDLLPAPEVNNLASADDIFNILPPGPESSNVATHVDVFSSFSERQSTPPSSTSPGSTPTYFSSEVFSPQSSYSSGDTDASQSLGSPQNSLYILPSTSGLSLASNSPSRLLPRTLPNTSDEEDDNQEGTTELRNLIDNELKEMKKHEWIQANMKDVDALISELRKIICKPTRLNDRKLVKVYAIISVLLKQNGDLRKFFMEEHNILSFVALKNHPLLLKYIIEIMQNLGLSPEAFGESPATILKKVIEQNQDMRKVLKLLLSLKTKNFTAMFDTNQVDQHGLTAIHRVLLKIKQMEDPEMKNLAISYLKICLESYPDFTIKTQGDNRTYLHHAIVLECGPHVIDLILRYSASQNPTFDLLNEQDSNGVIALQLASTLTQNRKEVEGTLLRYTDQNIFDLLNN